jgi:hypothetical protein
MCDIREKDLLFLTNEDKRESANEQFKQAVVACVMRNAALKAAAPLPQQAMRAPARDIADAGAAAGGNKADAVMHDFHPLKRSRSEEEFKEQLKRKRAEEQNAVELDPKVKLKRDVDDEFKRYTNVDEARGEDPLVWWRNNQLSFPLIAQLARELLAVPASSAGAERVFKSLSSTLSKRRRRLYDSKAEAIVFVHENRQLFAPDVWKLEQQRHREKEKKKAQQFGDPDPALDNIA